MIRTNLGRVPESSRVLPTAAPLAFHHDNTDRALLLLHGYTGYAGDMRFLAEKLFATGMSVVVPRYPGHGTNARDFRRSGWRDWWRRGIDAYLELASRYRSVSVAGLSMGGVIATLIASQFEVERLALYAPAFVVSNPAISLTPVFRFLVPPFRTGEPQEYPDDPDREFLSREYWNHNWPDKAYDLYVLIRKARRVLGSVAVPTLLVVSRVDGTVPFSVRDLVAKRIGSSKLETVVLEESDHVVTNGVERDTVAEESIRFFAKS